MRIAVRILFVATVLGIAGSALAQQQVSGRSVPKLKLNHEAMDKLGWKLSCQAYTFREMSLYETIDVLSAMGIRYVELYPGQALSAEKPSVKVGNGMSQAQIDELLAKLKSANVQAVAYGVNSIGKDGGRATFEFAKKMGIGVLTAEPTDDAFDALDALTDEYQINVAIHDHPKPSHYWDPAIVLKNCEGHSKRIGACADTGHWYRSGLVPVDCIKKLEGRIISLHFKDLNAGKSDVPWGTGVCDAKGMLVELKRQGVKAPFSIEYESGKGQELVDNVAKCAQWFSDMAGEMAK